MIVSKKNSCLRRHVHRSNEEQKKPCREKGQVTIELILILIVFTGISISVQRFFQSQAVIQKMVSGPWMVLSGMLQNGVWQSPKNSMSLHPNQRHRHLTLRGDTP